MKNSTIINLIKALKRKSLQSVLSFENVLAYLDCIMSASEEELPQVVRTELYKLGLCADNSFAIGNVEIDDFVKKSSFIYYPKPALAEVAGRIEDFAEREGLQAHARSVAIRFEEVAK